MPTPVGTKDAGERVGSSVARALWSPFLVVGGTHKRVRQAVKHFQNKLWLQLESRLYEKEERGHRDRRQCEPIAVVRARGGCDPEDGGDPGEGRRRWV